MAEEPREAEAEVLVVIVTTPALLFLSKHTQLQSAQEEQEATIQETTGLTAMQAPSALSQARLLAAVAVEMTLMVLTEVRAVAVEQVRYVLAGVLVPEELEQPEKETMEEKHL